MPVAARGLKEYLGGALGSKICDNEQTATALGDSKPSRIQNAPRAVQRPCVCQCIEDGGEVPPPMATEGTGDVFPKSQSWADGPDDMDGFIEEATALTIQSRAPSGYAQVLARAPEDDEINGREVRAIHLADIAVARHVGPVAREHALTGRINLDLPRAPPARAL